MDQCIDRRGMEYFKITLKDIESLMDYSWYCRLIMELEMNRHAALNKETDVEILTRSLSIIVSGTNYLPVIVDTRMW